MAGQIWQAPSLPTAKDMGSRDSRGALAVTRTLRTSGTDATEPLRGTGLLRVPQELLVVPEGLLSPKPWEPWP